jgi:predicted peptidase
MFDEVFSEETYEYSGRGCQNRVFRYRLFISDVSPPKKGLPLIVWLHGKGEAGNDNLAQLRYLYQLLFRISRNEQKYPFFLLAVQCPADNPVWTTSAQNSDDMINVVLAIVDKTTADYPIDLERITLAGLSSGGNGCWEMAVRHPDRFAGVAPISSSGGDPSRISRLVGVPVWAFNNVDDRSTPIDSVRASVRALQAAGGQAHLTEYQASGHDAWSAAFRRDDVLDWLLAQRRGHRSWMNAPGRNKGEHWIVMGLLGVPLLTVVTWWTSRWLRVRRRSNLPGKVG